MCFVLSQDGENSAMDLCKNQHMTVFSEAIIVLVTHVFQGPNSVSRLVSIQSLDKINVEVKEAMYGWNNKQ